MGNLRKLASLRVVVPGQSYILLQVYVTIFYLKKNYRFFGEYWVSIKITVGLSMNKNTEIKSNLFWTENLMYIFKFEPVIQICKWNKR